MDKYVYVSKHNATVVIRETITVLQPVANGAFKKVVAVPAVKLIFDNRICEVDETFASQFDMSLADMFKLIEDFRKKDATMKALFWPITGPGIVATKEQLDAADKSRKAAKENQTKVLQGTKDLSEPERL